MFVNGIHYSLMHIELSCLLIKNKWTLAMLIYDVASYLRTELFNTQVKSEPIELNTS